MRSQRKFFGNQDTEHLFDQALETAENVCAGIEAVDFTVFLEINDLMFSVRSSRSGMLQSAIFCAPTRKPEKKWSAI